MKKSTTILTVIICILMLCSCGRSSDFYGLNIGMTKDQIEKCVKDGGGECSKNIENRIKIKFDNPKDFPADNLSMTAYLDEGNLDHLIGNVTYSHPSSENKDEEYKNLVDYFKKQFGEGKEIWDDKYQWTGIKTKDGKNNMKVVLEKKIYSESEYQKMLKQNGIKDPSDLHWMGTQFSFMLSLED